MRGSRIFFSPQLILQKSNGQFQRNLSFFGVPEGVQHLQGGGGGRGVQHFQGGSNIFKGGVGSNIFKGGVQLFPGGGGGGRGSNCLFPIETHITCDFPGGYGPPVPPSGSALEIHIQIYKLQNVKGLERKLECLYYSSLS